MKTLKSIVAGMDSSPASDRALSEAQRIAKTNGSELTAVSVLEHGVVERLNFDDAMTRSKVTSEAEARMEQHGEGVLSHEHPVKFEFAIGDPFTEVQKAVADHHAELLVLGSGHDSGHIGAVASKCVRHARCDVLLVRENQRSAFRKIVVCVDFSSLSKEAVETGYRLAKQEGAVLELVHVFPPIEKMMARHYFIPVSSDLVSENDDIAVERVRQDLERLTESLDDDGIDCSVVILREVDHKRAIIDYLNSCGADLVVMGKHGRTNLREMLLGTTAERVVNHAQCSVLLVNPAR